MKDEKLDLPRLADFGRFSIALERGNGMEVGRIIATLKASYEAALGDNAEGNPVIPIIIEIVEENIIWSGSASELLKAVNEKGDDADKRLSLWPKTAEQLGKHLKRNHNVYASQGVSITQTRLKTGRRWELAIKRNHRIEEEVPSYDEIPLMS